MHAARRGAPPSRAVEAAHRSTLPEFVPPQLAVLAAAPPPGDMWRYEVKYDGYRMAARIDHGQVRLLSRNGNDWTARLPLVAEQLRRLKVDRAWLDGEIVVADGAGRTSFQALQKALDRHPARVEYVVFDMLHRDGTDLRERPLLERRSALADLLGTLAPGAAVRAGEFIDGRGEDAWREACRRGLEGVIAKRIDAVYGEGRSETWLKLKCRAGQEFVVGGFTEPAGSRSGFGALLVGVNAPDGALDYAGRVGTGFDDSALRALRKRLEALSVDTAPFRVPPRLRADRVHWVRPVLVAQVEFAEWTADGLLRQASFQGLREDKDARLVKRERARQAAVKASSASVRVTHPDRIVFSEPRVTKLEVVRYYERVAEAMMPHVRDRLLSFVRCPQGVAAECFFQKHIGIRLPAGVRQVQVPATSGADDYIAIETAAGIAGLAQYGTVEFHTWGSAASRFEHADRVIFDLDPDSDVPWPRVIEAARRTRALLEQLGLHAFLKTTGGKGLHVVAPIKPDLGWDTVKAFAQAVAQRLVSESPDRFTAQAAKVRRTGRIFIDYLRNARGATAVSAFSLRARAGAPVSLPIPWEALAPRRDVRAAALNLRNVDEHLEWSRDAWRGYDEARVRLGASSLRAMGLAAR